jgi:hypothetical protein
MATIYKNLNSDDVVSTRTLLHEAIPITGTIVSGTYNTVVNDEIVEQNIKNFGHGRFQSVYDYPFLSSSANHIFDLSIGVSPQSALQSGITEQKAKKTQMYNQMAQLLVGHDIVGNILEFDEDGNLIAGGDKLQEVVFITFSRLLVKDEIKKGSFVLRLQVGPTSEPETVSITDAGAQDDYRVNSPSGEYAILKYSVFVGDDIAEVPVGLIYYQAGVIVLNRSVLELNALTDSVLQTSTIEDMCDIVRSRWISCDFVNTTELNSTIYFCRVNHNEFNYSSNPTYLENSQIRVKETSVDAPISYITTVGLYSDANELLAVAKLSEPLKKDPTNEMILRVRLDY